MANNKLVEDFRLKIKSIFKESVDNDPLDQRPDASGKPTMPPKPTGPPVDINEADEIAPGAEVAPEAGAEATPPVEEEKVTLSVSLLSSLLNWAHGEEEAEEPQAGAEGTPEAPEAPEAPLTEEDATPAPTAPVDPAATTPEGDDTLEDAGVEAIEIEALVTKIKELAQTKEVLTDEDFGEIVAAAEATEGEGEDLTGVMGDEGSAEAPAEPIQEEIGKIIPTGAKFKNEGNKGIGK